PSPTSAGFLPALRLLHPLPRFAARPPPRHPSTTAKPSATATTSAAATSSATVTPFGYSGALRHRDSLGHRPPPQRSSARWLLVGIGDEASHQRQERCLKVKLSRKKVKFHHKTGSRCYIAQTHVVKDKYKDVPPTAIDLFKDLHCSSKTGLSEPVREAIEQMEAIMTGPTDEGQDPKTPTDVLNSKIEECEVAKQKQKKELETVKKTCEETNGLLRRLLGINRE
ncbi:unnamed protein product, partial [Urochloa humidicola]